MSDTLWIRKVGLLVYNPPPSNTAPGSGLDLSEMRITFEVEQSNFETPNTMRCRVFNLKDTTSQQVSNEFTRVSLAAGYQNGPYGTIFDGTIKQVLRGRASPTDTYIDIFAADGDIAYNQSVLNTTINGPVDSAARLKAIQDSFGAKGVPPGYTLDLPATATLPRSKVLYGLTRDYARDFASTVDADWSIQNGKVEFVARHGYKPGEAVELDPRSGLVGIPTQTSGGVMATCLLNPNIGCGGLVKINHDLVAQGPSGATAQNLFGATRLESLAGFNAKISQSGFYKVLVAEHAGDSRGNDWYSTITCLAVDPSAAAGAKVQPFWAGGNAPP